MTKQLSTSMIGLTQDACLSAFWRKAALSLFLKQHGVSQSYINALDSQTKREFLTKLFHDLISKKNGEGHSIILRFACSLSEMKSFPDLENHEDSPQKLSNAHKSIQRLKSEVDKINTLLNNESESKIRIERERAIQETILKTSQSFKKLSEEFYTLCSQLGTQQAGYDFEAWFYKLAVVNEIDARPSYKDAYGRQIDGSITVGGTTYLIESKFTRESVGSPEIDVFDRKIMRMAENTMGIMISISGYNENAIKIASRERTPILLLDYSHIINFILNERMSLKEVIERVRRHASQTGESFLSAGKFSG